MRTKHITTKTTLPDGAQIEKDNIEWGKTGLRSYRIKIKVMDSNEEMAEYVIFTTEVAKLRQRKILAVDKDDFSTHPAFIIQYPKYDADGSYFIIKTYTIYVDL